MTCLRQSKATKEVRMRFALRFSLFLCVGLLLTAPMALAQASVGAIEGTVLDANGAPLPGVTVEAKSPSLQGTRVTVTDNGGRFRFPALPPGVYSLTATLSGAQSVSQSGIGVALGGTITVPMTMSLTAKEAVVVSAQAPVIDTTKTTIGTST